jgi:hypothetical protein
MGLFLYIFHAQISPLTPEQISPFKTKLSQLSHISVRDHRLGSGLKKTLNHGMDF